MVIACPEGAPPRNPRAFIMVLEVGEGGEEDEEEEEVVVMGGAGTGMEEEEVGAPIIDPTVEFIIP